MKLRSKQKAVLVLLSAQFFLAEARAQQGEDIRARSAAIDYRHATSIDDYLNRCSQVQRLLPELDQFYRTTEVTILRLRNRHPDNPQWVKLGNVIVALNAKDIAGVALLKQEMNLALDMQKLLPNKRQAFFDQRILPLQKREDSIADEEIRIAVKARNEGVPLPDDVLKRISDR